MGVEDIKRQTPETQKDKNPESSIENINTPEALQKLAEVQVAKIQKTGDQIIAEGISLAKTPEEKKVIESTKQEVEKIVGQTKETSTSGFKEWQDARDQELQDSLKSIDIKNPAQLAQWFENNSNERVEENSSYIMGDGIRDHMDELLLAIQDAYKVDLDDKDPVNFSERREFDGYGEGMLHGDMSMLGRDVCSYSTSSDGYGGRINEWNAQALEESMKEFLEKLQAAKK